MQPYLSVSDNTRKYGQLVNAVTSNVMCGLDKNTTSPVYIPGIAHDDIT